MNKQVNNIKEIRSYLLDVIKDVNPNQLNKVPDAFNNNIIWNIGHLIAAQQGICYVRANATPVINANYTALYKPGTKPGEFVDVPEIENIKKLFLNTIDRLDTDLQNNVFANYNPWKTRYGVELTNIDDALDFIVYHEGLHAGQIMALKKLV